MIPTRVILAGPSQRAYAKNRIDDAAQGSVVTIKAPSRSIDQNKKFHAICRDFAQSKVTWAGTRRNQDEWKALLVSAHAVATGHAGEVVPGLEGEFVSIRESTSKMNKDRASSLIEYALAWGNQHGIQWSDEARAA